MKGCFVKNIMPLFAVLLMVGCAQENFENDLNSNDVQEKEFTNVYEKWMDEFKDYDLEKVLEEERNDQLINGNDDVDMLHRKKRRRKGKPVFVHYMPWFQSLERDGVWGQHWTMTNRNPDIIESDGKRQIASHYYPLIGSYSTRDKDLQQYHLLLMKLSGVDGVIFDWYGKRNVLDFRLIKKGMESFIKELEKTSLEFAVMYEDRVVHEQARGLSDIQINQAVADLKYIKRKYFTNPKYFKVKGRNLMMIFGPNYITQSSDWDKIFNDLKAPMSLLTLWGARKIVGEEHSAGEYAWIDRNHLQTLSGYYNNVIDFDTNIVGGVAYPRFNDYYIEGGWKDPMADDWVVEDRGLDVFSESFDESLKHPVDFVQIATWNDFGEGTMIEPTAEFGFDHLELLQDYTKTTYTKEDLMIPYSLYQLKKQHKTNENALFLLNRAYRHANRNDLRKAKKLISIVIRDYGAGTIM